MTKQIYFDALFTGLVPVKVLGRIGDTSVYQVRVTKDTGAYKKGETISTFAYWLVNKVKATGPHIKVVQTTI